MATNTTTINIRVDKITKTKAQKIVGDLGLDLSSAVKVFLKKMIETKSIPFLIEQSGRLNNPAYLVKLKKEIEYAKKYGKRFSSAEDFMDDILH